jgi:uncharacterized protein YjbI with pentapeptide repeats
MAPPEIEQNSLYHLLKNGNIEEFNRQRKTGATGNLRGVDLRHVDLRGLDAAGLDLGDCYLRNADLRALDLRETNLEGASISGAKISGTYFPDVLSAEEINLSLQHGTRLRYR